MGKRKEPENNLARERDLFTPLEKRRRSRLILARFLKEEADKLLYRGPERDNAHKILIRWADLEQQGHLAKKETSLDANFLQEVFGNALGYRSSTESPEEYEREQHFSIPGVGEADGALGNFRPGAALSPSVVMELKGAHVNLDKDKFNGRTPVQQCWDYLDGLPGCPWGIVSNFVTFRLYHRRKTPLAYEEFRLQDLRDPAIFRQFWCLFERGGLVRPRTGWALRALELLERTENRQREVGDELYDKYSDHRVQLIEHLCSTHGKSLEQAIHIAQKILDRIIFVAFCEDRGLLPEKCIDKAYKNLPPFYKVTNPRWQNFLALFEAIDGGHPELLDIQTGYDGGLFAHDDEVDNLQLDDNWTNFFRTIGGYDFRDEVNVDVLGHLFEKSVAELEKLRLSGLYPVVENANGTMPKMRKSAERKRFGIYYTPPDFTHFIVENTVGEVLRGRLADVRQSHGLKPEDAESDKPSKKLADFWADCAEAVRSVKVCDAACGSGAFLIQAYELFDTYYQKIVEQLLVHDPKAADKLEDKVPDRILTDNLYGVDVSPQAVEITQLALWIRSARRNKTLADLSHNIVWGNSLVTDPAVHPKAMDWNKTFDNVFSRAESPGFDCVIGNPPWERLKLQEREFFAFSAPKIAGAVSAAKRRQMIDAIRQSHPELYERYEDAKKAAENTLAHVRQSGNFPLTAKGDINTYVLFAELARKIVAPTGRVGLLVPSGIASDKTTKEFFAKLTNSQSLVALYDFENRKRIFPDVDGRYKFSILLFGGIQNKNPNADFVFFSHSMEDLKDKDRHIPLSAKDMALLNPNTRTCPIFRSRRDAKLTKAIYRRVPVLIDRTRKSGGNPWGIKFFTMFHQTNNAELFHTAEQLSEMGFRLEGNRWRKRNRTFLPLYEAKMVQAYDHRAAGIRIEAENWMRQGQTETTTLVLHQNPEFVALPRWWVDEREVVGSLGGQHDRGFLGFKDITSPTNQRTMIASAIPWSAVTNHFPLIIGEAAERLRMCLLANLNSHVLDYVARQKIGGVTLNFFIVEQLPMFPPDRYADHCPWNKRQTLERWISDRVLKLTCTADDMRPLAEAAKFKPGVHKWKAEEREKLMAELDAAFFLLYGVKRNDAEYILNTFAGQKRKDETLDMFSGENLVLEAYDRLSRTKS